jgi:hypothetical protein
MNMLLLHLPPEDTRWMQSSVLWKVIVATVFLAMVVTIVSSRNPSTTCTYCIKGSVTTLLACACVLRCVAAIGIDRDFVRQNDRSSRKDFLPALTAALQKGRVPDLTIDVSVDILLRPSPDQSGVMKGL